MMYHLDFEPLPKRLKLVRSRDILSKDPEWNETVYGPLISGWNNDVVYTPAPIRLFKKRNFAEIMPTLPESINNDYMELRNPPQSIKKSKRLHGINELDNTATSSLYNTATSIDNPTGLIIEEDTETKEAEEAEEDAEDAEAEEDTEAAEHAEDAVHAGYALNGLMMSLFSRTAESMPIASITKLVEQIETLPDYVSKLTNDFFNVKIDEIQTTNIK